MRTYRVLYRIGPQVGEVKELEVDAPSGQAATSRAREVLALRYPHYRLVGVYEAGTTGREAAEPYRLAKGGRPGGGRQFRKGVQGAKIV